MKKNFLKLFKTKKPIIGMIHLLPMPDSNGFIGFEATLAHALNELKSLELGGIDGVLVENDNDSPYQVLASPPIIATMTAITREIKKMSKVPVGIEVLINDPKSSLSIAQASNADFIRTDYFVDKMYRAEYGGEMYINPKELLAFRKKIKAENIFILADVQVKHATLLETNKKISESIAQTEQAGADGIIISGDLTGYAPKIDDLNDLKNVKTKLPILIGSGFSAENALSLLENTNGAIVGTSIKDGLQISVTKTQKLMKIVKYKAQ